MSEYIEVISSKIVTARKEYYDDAWEFISDFIHDGCDTSLYPDKPLSFSEKRALVYYRNNRREGARIMPGQLYKRQFNKYEGEAYTFRTKQLFFELCCRYELFPEL